MPELVRKARDAGYSIFVITSLPAEHNLRDITKDNLRSAGYDMPLGKDRLFLRDHNSYGHLDCTEAGSGRHVCDDLTTVQYKSGVRGYIESQGYDVVASFGDQYSDLQGGHAGKTVKLPNPMYYRP